MYEFLAVFDHPSDQKIELMRIDSPRGTSAPLLLVDGVNKPSEELPFADKVDWPAFTGWDSVLKTKSTFIDYDASKAIKADPAAGTTVKLSGKLDARTLFTTTMDKDNLLFVVRPTGALNGSTAHLDDDGHTIIPDSVGDVVIWAFYDGERQAHATVTIES